jgi:hypothetical protein
MMKGIHLRARTKWRREMKELKHKREEQRKNATMLYEKFNEQTKIIDGEKKNKGKRN